jgi:solute:Na+ symporter, SSS family
VLFMLTTSLSQDLYKRFINRSADERQVLLVARITTVVAGALGTAIAIVSPTVIGVLTIFYTLLGVSLFVPILGGLYVPRAATRHALVAMLLGVGTVLAVQFATGGQGYGMWTPALIGLIAAIAGFVVMLALAPRAQPAPAA